MLPEPGDYFVVKTGGLVAGGIRLITNSPVNHAGLHVGGGVILEASPDKGIRRASMYDYNTNNLIWSHKSLTLNQRYGIVNWAWSKRGTPYNFIDIGAIALAQVFDVRLPKLVRMRLSAPDHEICSQFVDDAYNYGGNVHLFDDGRLSGDVTPDDLFDIL